MNLEEDLEEDLENEREPKRTSEKRKAGSGLGIKRRRRKSMFDCRIF